MHSRVELHPASASRRPWAPWFVAFFILLIVIIGCNINFNPQPIPPPFPGQGPLPTTGFEHTYDPPL
jgi:hypothetical protein